MQATALLASGLVRFDTLAVTMFLLVAFLGAVVLRFAARYLEGDPSRRRFLAWMSLTIAAVLTLVVSNHLLLLLGAWTATGLCLNRLLLHHPDRPGAVFAARKKFVFSRLAEFSLLAAAILLHHGHSTWRIDELVASIGSGNTAGLHLAAGPLLAGTPAPPVPAWLTLLVTTAFAALFLFQSLLWRASAHPLGRRLYVHALNGFYVGTLANRMLNRLWPTQPSA